MKNTVYDASAVDTYINELNSREAEITRSMQIQNFKREVPAKVFLWCGYAVPIIILILILGFAINKALSFERIEKTVIENSAHDLTNQANPLLDQVIDIDKILNEDPTFPEGVGNESEEKEVVRNEKEVVRNYVIFDYIPFSGKIIKQISVGREYESPGSPSNRSWCYVGLDYSGIEQTIYLVQVKEDKRSLKNLNQEIANNFGVSLTELREAQKKCNI